MDIAKLVCCEALLPCTTAFVLSELQLGCCALHLLAQSQRDIVLVCVDSNCGQQYMGAVQHDAVWVPCNMSQCKSSADLDFDNMMSSEQACHSSQ